MKTYALIKDNIVQNTIVAEPEFIALISSSWDHCVRVDTLSTPDKWTKEGEQDVFQQPMLDETTPDESWTYVQGTRQPGIGWSYDGENFTPPVEE